MKRNLKQLILNKNGEKFIFRYQQGSENHLLDTLVEQAKDEKSSFGWFDASVLSFKLTQNLIDHTDDLIHKNSPNQASLLG